MLQAMRSGAKSPLMKFFLLFLAGGFALWGIGDGTTGLIGGSDKAVSAGDVAISPRRVALEFERARRNFLPNSSTQEALQGGLLNEVTGALSRDVLLRAESNELGLTITRAMQRGAIRNENSFKDELGQFSEGRFIQMLRGAGLSEEDYLERVDGALFREQLIGAVAAGARFDVTTSRAVAAFDLERRKVRLTSFTVSPEKIATPDAEAIKAFFTENKTNYRAPDMRSARIAIVSAEMIAKNLNIAVASKGLAKWGAVVILCSRCICQLARRFDRFKGLKVGNNPGFDLVKRPITRSRFTCYLDNKERVICSFLDHADFVNAGLPDQF